MTLYYKLGQTPAPRPARLVLQNGLARNEYSEEELLEAGYIQAPPKPLAYFPQRVDWKDGTWIVRDPSEGEKNTQIIAIRTECKKRLSESDYVVIKAQEVGTVVSEEWRTYRQRLRDIYNLINVENIWAVEWPSKP